MSAIIEKLDRVAEAREALEAARAEVPAEVQAKISAAEAEVKAAEAEVKAAAKFISGNGKHTIAGKILQLVYVTRITYPSKALEAEVPEELLAKVRKTSSSWAIRKRGEA
jgi:hypothetical protein